MTAAAFKSAKRSAEFMSDLTLESMVKLNHRFDAVLVPHLINETFLSGFHQVLEPFQNLGGPCFWLLYARLTEAALLCAGYYADNCEFTAAGDLLVNPRRIRLHDKSDPCHPKTKIRHMALSQQFKPDSIKTETFRKQFSTDMTLAVETPPLLPILAETMQDAGVFREGYLASVTRRMEEIADTLTFLLAWGVDSVQELEQRRSAASDEMQNFIKANLCCFGRTAFNALGGELRAMEHNRFSASAYLKESWTKNMYPSCEEPEHDRTIPFDERPQAFL